MVRINENKELDLELFLDYETFIVYMSKGGRKLVEWMNMSLKEINDIVKTYFA